MPIRKTRLTQDERNKYVNALKLLVSVGADIDDAQLTGPERGRLRISQCGPELNHKVFNLYQVKSAIVVEVRLVATCAEIIITDCHFVLPWDLNHSLSLLGISDRSLCYRPAKGLEFDRDNVLNHRIMDGGLRLRRGELVEGLLIATGAAPLPEGYVHGMPVEVELLLADQFDEVHSAKVELRADHGIGGKRVDLRKPNTSLFERQHTMPLSGESNDAARRTPHPIMAKQRNPAESGRRIADGEP